MIGGVPAWLPLALIALVFWALQRLLSKLALTDLGTGRFYLLSAVVSLLTYAPYLATSPPRARDLPPALGLACLMAVTFGVTTEAIRRGPLGAVSPITALSPALTALLSVALLGERLPAPAYPGDRPGAVGHRAAERWTPGADGPAQVAGARRAVARAAGIGAFVAKLVVTRAGRRACC